MRLLHIQIILQQKQTGVGISKITEYYLTSNSTNVSDVLTGNWSTSMQIPNKDAKYLWNYSEIEYTNGNKSAQSPRIIGNFAEDGASGSDAYTVLLTNENHTFVANHLGATTEQIVYSDVIAIKVLHLLHLLLEHYLLYRD